MSKVYIYCDGGFGNRFSSLISGLFLAEVCQREPLIIWRDTNWNHASFTDIFDSQVQEYKEFDHTRFFDEVKPVMIISWDPWNRGDLERHNCLEIAAYIDKFLIDKTDKDVFIYTSTIPMWVDINNLQSVLEKGSFKSYMLTAARTFILDNFGSDQFNGLHVRRTDHAFQIDEDEFIQKINEDGKLCFICSDDPDAEEHFKTRCPNVRVYPKTSYVEKLIPDGDWNTVTIDELGYMFDYNVKRSRESVLQAMIDLLILSKSNILNIDYRSTFLKSAMLINKYNLV